MELPKQGTKNINTQGGKALQKKCGPKKDTTAKLQTNTIKRFMDI